MEPYVVEPLFAGKVAVVTGAAHGFGRSISIELTRRGARVIGVDVLLDELAETKNAAEEAAMHGGSCEVKVVDVTNEHDVNNCVDDVVHRHGTVDILVNNAGGVLGQVHKPVETVTSEEWASIVAVNMTAAFYFIRAVTPTMKKHQYGRIVNVSSGAGRSFSLTGIQAYASAKAGQIGLTRQMARELGPHNITVNNVAPGFVRSNKATEKQWQAMGEDGQQKLLDSIALRRLGRPEEVAYAVLFFASDYASYVSGQVISADGGNHMF